MLRDIRRNISANIPGKWLLQLLQEVDREPQTLHLVLVEVQHLIESNTRIYMLFQEMFQEIDDCPYEVHSYQELLQVLNHIITRGPAWSHDLLQTDSTGLTILVVVDRVKVHRAALRPSSIPGKRNGAQGPERMGPVSSKSVGECSDMSVYFRHQHLY